MKKTNMSITWLLVASFINNFAAGFIWPVTTVYLHNNLQQSLITVGWVILANSIGQAYGSILSGRLFDRFAPYRLIQIGVALMIATQISFILFHGWPLYALNLTVCGFLSGWILAILNAYGTRVVN